MSKEDVTIFLKGGMIDNPVYPDSKISIEMLNDITNREEFEFYFNFFRKLFSYKIRFTNSFGESVKSINTIVIKIGLYFGFKIDNFNVQKVVFEEGNKLQIEKNRILDNVMFIRTIMNFLIYAGLEIAIPFLKGLCLIINSNSSFSKIQKEEMIGSWIELYSKNNIPSECYVEDRENNFKKKEYEQSEIKERIPTINLSQLGNQQKQTKLSSKLGLKYNQNSCYMDSILVPLFLFQNNDIEFNLFNAGFDFLKNKNKLITCNDNPNKDLEIRKNIQRELSVIRDRIRSNEQNNDYTCSNLRNIIQYCKGTQEFHTTRIQDAGEFLSYIFSIFNVVTKITTRSTFLTNDIKSNEPNDLVLLYEQLDNGTPILTIEFQTIFGLREYDISGALNKTEDAILDNNNLVTYKNKLYKRRIETFKVVDASYLVFDVKRVGINLHTGEEERNFTKINLPMVLNIEERKLELRAIVVHDHQHYTCYILDNGEVYYYNDLREPNERFVPVTEKNKDKFPSPFTHGTLYFYN